MSFYTFNLSELFMQDCTQLHDVFFILQAILGGTIQVPTLTGDVVLKVLFTFIFLYAWQSFHYHCILILHYVFNLSNFYMQVRAGTQPGQKVVLKGKGATNLLRQHNFFFPLICSLLLVMQVLTRTLQRITTTLISCFIFMSNGNP